MKRKIYLTLLTLAILSLICCLFAGCKKENNKPKDSRQFDVEGFGANTCYYVNGIKTNYSVSTGYLPVNAGDALKVCSDTSSNFPTCKIDLRIFDGNNNLIDEKVSQTAFNQTIVYTVK